jgi:hypothetical protein
VYHLSFQGQATVAASDPAVQIQNLTWSPVNNSTTANVNVPAGTSVLTLIFTNTHRSPDAAANTGITNMKLFRPAYSAGTGQVYTRGRKQSQVRLGICHPTRQRVQKGMWIPVSATDVYIRQLALLLKSRFCERRSGDSGRRVL